MIFGKYISVSICMSRLTRYIKHIFEQDILYYTPFYSNQHPHLSCYYDNFLLVVATSLLQYSVIFSLWFQWVWVCSTRARDWTHTYLQSDWYPQLCCNYHNVSIIVLALKMHPSHTVPYHYAFSCCALQSFSAVCWCG